MINEFTHRRCTLAEYTLTVISGKNNVYSYYIYTHTHTHTRARARACMYEFPIIYFVYLNYYLLFIMLIFH